MDELSRNSVDIVREVRLIFEFVYLKALSDCQTRLQPHIVVQILFICSIYIHVFSFITNQFCF